MSASVGYAHLKEGLRLSRHFRQHGIGPTVVQGYDTTQHGLRQQRMVASIAGNRSKRSQHGGRYRVGADFKTSPIKISSYKVVEKGANNLSAEENAYSLQKLEGFAQQCLSQIRCFRTILLPVVAFAEHNNEETKTHIVTKTLFEEAYAKFIGKGKGDVGDITARRTIFPFNKWR